MFGFGRATHGFDARKHCDKRRYEYILPAWAFDPALVPPSSLLGEEDGEAVPLLETEEDGETASALGDDEDTPAAGGDAAGDPGDAPPGTRGGVTPSVEADGALAASTGVSQPEDTGFIFDAACAARMTSILSAFEGTHNFHNFTVRVAASAPNARRYILSFRWAGLWRLRARPGGLTDGAGRLVSRSDWRLNGVDALGGHKRVASMQWVWVPPPAASGGTSSA